MTEKRSDYIYIPELALQVDPHISEEIACIDAFSIAPTLAQLRRIFAYCHEHHIEIGNERGEWTSDFVDYDPQIPRHVTVPDSYLYVHFISRPSAVVKKPQGWIARGGLTTPVLLPPDGWVVPNQSGELFDKRTGLPYVTTQNMEDATASDYSYFWRAEIGSGLRAVNRECERIQGNSFEISIVQTPDFPGDNIGVRKVFAVERGLPDN